MSSYIGSDGLMAHGVRAISRFRLEQSVILGFEAWFAGEHDQIVDRCFAPDATVINHCPLHLSCFGGVHYGRAAIARGFRCFMADFLISSPNVATILTDGRHVAISYSVHLRHVGTGRSGVVAGMSHVTLGRSLRVARMENFFDTAALAEVGELLEDFVARSEAIDRFSRVTLPSSTGLEEVGLC